MSDSMPFSFGCAFRWLTIQHCSLRASSLSLLSECSDCREPVNERHSFCMMSSKEGF